jgi:coenzyme F420-reducing hydrogenase delta subunit
MCSGRVDLAFVLRAFSNGMDGVFIGGCRLNECNYTTQGNYDALGMVLLCRILLEKVGLDPQRLRIEFMSSADGILFTQVANNFIKKIKELGPLGRGEAIDLERLKIRLNSLLKLVPYIRLVERERLRVPVRSEEAYRRFFESEDVRRLIDELILERLAQSEIMALLSQRPLSAGEISEQLGKDSTEVTRHIKLLSRQGLVRYDMDQRRFAVAW